jgi:hypothetical protein
MCMCIGHLYLPPPAADPLTPLGQRFDPRVRLGGARLATRRLEGRAVARLHRPLRCDRLHIG